MSSIFISYSRKDLAIAEKIVSALAESKLDTWIDWKSIPKGEKFEKEIYQGIEGANVFLFLISPESVQSDWCKKEIVQAIINNKRIIPILVQDSPKDSIPLGVSERNWISCLEKQDDFRAAIEEILETIHTDYEWVKYQTKLQVKALEWERRKDNSRLLRGKELQEAEQQLAIAGSQKDAQPTDLQRSYVLASRKDDVRRRRQITIGLTIGFIAVSVLCVIAVAASFIAVGQRNQAVSKENVRATAQANAEEQANIALGRQLAAQAQLTSLNAREDTVLSGLLAIESLKRYPSLEGDLAINRVLGVLGYPTNSTEIGTVTSMAFSTDRKWLVTGNSDGLVQVWDIIAGQERARLSQNSEIVDVAFSPDKKLIISGELDNTIYVWNEQQMEPVNIIHLDGSLSSFIVSPDGRSIAAMILLDTGEWVISIKDILTGFEEFRILTDTDNPITPLAFNTGGNLLAIYDVNKNNEAIVFIWDVRLKKETAKFISNNSGNWINTVTFGNNGSWIASGDRQGSVHIWDIATGKEIFQANMGLPVYDLVFSPNDNFLMGANFCWRKEICDTEIAIWDTNTGQEIASMPEPGGFYDLDISPDGKYLASANGDGTARIWDISMGKELGRILHPSSVLRIAFTQDGNSLISVDESGELKTWWFGSLSAGKYEIQENGITVAKKSPKGDNFVTVNYDNVARVRDIVTGQEITNIQLKSQVYNLQFSSDGNWVASPFSTQDGSIIIWDANTGKEVARINHQGGVSNVAFSPDGKWLASSGNYFVCIWELPSGIEKKCGQFDSTEFPYPPSELAFSPGGKSIAVTLGYSTQILDTDTLQKITELSNGYATDPTFSPDGKLLATGELAIGFPACTYCSGHIWDISTGKEVFTLPPGGRVSSVEFSSNGLWLLTASQDGIARIWDVNAAQEVSKMIHSSSVNTATFNDDGSLVISSSADGDVRIWEASTGHELARAKLQGASQSQGMQYAGFTNDRKTALLINGSGTIKLWVWQSQDLITELCSRLYRNMTQDEWTYYFGNSPYQPTCSDLPALVGN